MLPQIIDASMLATFSDCPTSFFNSYVLRKRGQNVAPGTPASTVESIHLKAGGALAAGCEAYRIAHYIHGLKRAECLDHAIAAATVRWGEADPFPLEEPHKQTSHLIHAKSLNRVIMAIYEYFRHYDPATDDFQPEPTTREGSVSFEYGFMYPLESRRDVLFPLHPDTGEPFILAGKLDGLGTYKHLPSFLDEKTTTAIGRTWVQQWRNRFQFITYRWLLREIGKPHEHCLIRGVAIQKTQIKFAEHPQHIPAHLLDTWEWNVVNMLNRMIDYYKNGTWPRNMYSACTSYSGCEFLDVCTANPRHSNAILATYGLNDWEPGVIHPQPKVVDLLNHKELAHA